ncbi:MAG: prepilin-type N-terminal cleavage/methylation domain-containing protein [Myxococcales bacterium]|nr:prepilin-type N-terminal cleavage/methylation domain-containing protein [Myxococcales bacterium]MCB9576393.1 prepilin-type N-terminal cleavage/methylation domain-containing protein [Polyangiaceae bacterium]
MTQRGFTLLEVLVAIAILGLGLTVILSSQVGLFSSAQRAETLSVATNLARCKMSEEEVELLTKGYPLVESHDEGECCEDEDSRGFRCEWKVERVELPQPQELSGGDGGLGDQGGLGALGALATVQQTNGAALGTDGGIGGLASLLSGAAAGGGTQGMAPLVMSLVYPDLKPMLEASIRKVTVKVLWKEGSKERSFDLVQYVTNPQQGGLDPNAAKGLDQLLPEE